MKIIHWQKTSKKLDCPLSPTGKEARYVYTLLFFVIIVNKIIDLGIDFKFNHGL